MKENSSSIFLYSGFSPVTFPISLTMSHVLIVLLEILLKSYVDNKETLEIIMDSIQSKVLFLVNDASLVIFNVDFRAHVVMLVVSKLQSINENNFSDNYLWVTQKI